MEFSIIQQNLQVQLEVQKKSYEDMKQQMRILQSAQPGPPGEGHLISTGSGYADFSDIDNSYNPPTAGAVHVSQNNSSSDDYCLLTDDANMPDTDMTANGNVGTPSETKPIAISDTSDDCCSLTDDANMPHTDPTPNGNVMPPVEMEPVAIGEGREESGPTTAAAETSGSASYLPMGSI